MTGAVSEIFSANLLFNGTLGVGRSNGSIEMLSLSCCCGNVKEGDFRRETVGMLYVLLITGGLWQSRLSEKEELSKV